MTPTTRIIASIIALMAILGTGTAAQAAVTDTIHIPTVHVPAPAAVTVVVPQSYTTDTATHYPVVYLLHGYGDNHAAFAERIPLDSLADSHGVIFVCPDGLDSWYFDSPADPSMQMETYLTSDLIPTVDHRLRTIADRRHRAIAGLSMGGHGALWTAIRHSDLFASAGTMSGGVDFNTPRFRNSWKIKNWLGTYDSAPEIWNTHTVMSLVPSLQPGQLRIIVACGDEDFFIEVNNRLHRALSRRSIGHVYTVTPGNHSWAYWRRTLPVIMDFFDESFTHQPQP